MKNLFTDFLDYVGEHWWATVTLAVVSAWQFLIGFLPIQLSMGNMYVPPVGAETFMYWFHFVVSLLAGATVIMAFIRKFPSFVVWVKYTWEGWNSISKGKE